MSNLSQMLSICLFWAVLFIVVFCITRRMGLNSSLPARTKEIMKQVRKHCASISALYSNISSEDGPKGALPDKRSVIKQLRKLSKLVLKADSLLQVHLYDNGEDVDIQAVRKRQEAIVSSCGDAARSVRTDDVESLKEILDTIQRLAAESCHVLEEVCRRSEIEKLERL